jgi:DNA topoisomerase I
MDRASLRLARWIRVISSIARNTDRYINACDYDLEGSVIGYTVLQYACNGAHTSALRMKFSTLTERELRLSYQRLDHRLESSLVDAGKCRHELDWLYGINLSRLLTESALNQGRGYATLSTGRVQGPALGFVVEREGEIACFVPLPFWTISATTAHNGEIYQLEYQRDKVETKSEAEAVSRECRDEHLAVTDIESRDVQQAPPYPFDLSSLQSEAYRHLGFSPARTLALAERLYLGALISYPRTSSQKLPADIGYAEILGGIGSQAEYRALAAKLISRGAMHPNNGPRDDPAHPAIFPTGNSPKRSGGPETKLYDLISRRFMATFAESGVITNSRIIVKHKDHRFFLSGSRTTKLGWIEYYRPYVSVDSRHLPDLKVGDQVKIQDIKPIEKFTQPPHRYNPGSLLKKMEDANIGTKATRAGIIELLYARGYVKDERMRASEVADKVNEVLSIYCPLIIDPSFTSNLENQMEEIQNEKSSRRLVLVEAMDHLRSIMLLLAQREEEVGSELSKILIAQRAAEVTFDSPCPKCGLRLEVVRSRRTSKRFIGCRGKWQGDGCNFTLPLPQFGRLTLLNRRCSTCGFQMIQARSTGRRPLISCPSCYSARAQKRNSSPSGRIVTLRTIREAPSVT